MNDDPRAVPGEAHAAMRDLVRAREAAVKDVRKRRQRIQGFLLRHGRRYVGAVWKKQHRVWLANQSFTHPAQQIAFQTYLNAIGQALERKDLIDQRIKVLVPGWPLAPAVEALQAWRGAALAVAAGAVAETGAMRRFDHPRQPAAFPGLVPGEHSSGSKRKLAGIATAGSLAARRLIAEAAFAYRAPAKIGQAMMPRQQAIAAPIRAIAWNARIGLCARYRRLLARGKKKTIVITAIARALGGFIWAIGSQIALEPAIASSRASKSSGAAARAPPPVKRSAAKTRSGTAGLRGSAWRLYLGDREPNRIGTGNRVIAGK